MKSIGRKRQVHSAPVGEERERREGEGTGDGK